LESNEPAEAIQLKPTKNWGFSKAP